MILRFDLGREAVPVVVVYLHIEGECLASCVLHISINRRREVEVYTKVWEGSGRFGKAVGERLGSGDQTTSEVREVR
jgi:hypothetical protein